MDEMSNGSGSQGAPEEGEPRVIDVDSQVRALELAGELSAAPGQGGKPLYEWLEVRPFLNDMPNGEQWTNPS